MTNFPENFTTEVAALNIEPKKLTRTLDVINKYLHSDIPTESQPIHTIAKMVISMMKFSDSKYKKMNDNFLFELMEVDMKRDQFYALLDIVDKHYDSKNIVKNSPKM